MFALHSFPSSFPELLDQLSQRRKLLLVYKLKPINKEDKVLETSIEVVLHPQAHDVLEVGVINMRVNPEEPLKDDFDGGTEVLGERDPDLGGEKVLIVELDFDPGHQEVNVLARGDLQWRPHVLPVCPQIFVLRTGRHDGAALWRAELSQSTVNKVDLVVELNCVDR